MTCSAALNKQLNDPKINQVILIPKIKKENTEFRNVRKYDRKL
jgi:hypothetical protein